YCLYVVVASRDASRSGWRRLTEGEGRREESARNLCESHGGDRYTRIDEEDCSTRGAETIMAKDSSRTPEHDGRRGSPATLVQAWSGKLKSIRRR
ncbi:hypothetical protein LTR17_027755, partial [Elasticomyces elasticus]